MTDPYIIQLQGLAGGIATSYDGQYLQEYDPGRPGRSPEGLPMIAHVVTTADPHQALEFRDSASAFECWRQVDPENPTRGDGRPNRPLTAFTVEIARRSTFTGAVA